MTHVKADNGPSGKEPLIDRLTVWLHNWLSFGLFANKNSGANTVIYCCQFALAKRTKRGKERVVLPSFVEILNGEWSHAHQTESFLYRLVQLDLTPKIEVLHMMFE